MCCIYPVLAFAFNLRSICVCPLCCTYLILDVNGVPHDWTHEAPPLAGEAHNASFVFPVRADNQ